MMDDVFNQVEEDVAACERNEQLDCCTGKAEVQTT
jgi:hypothetical protein